MEDQEKVLNRETCAIFMNSLSRAFEGQDESDSEEQKAQKLPRIGLPPVFALPKLTDKAFIARILSWIPTKNTPDDPYPVYQGEATMKLPDKPMELVKQFWKRKDELLYQAEIKLGALPAASIRLVIEKLQAQELHPCEALRTFIAIIDKGPGFLLKISALCMPDYRVEIFFSRQTKLFVIALIAPELVAYYYNRGERSLGNGPVKTFYFAKFPRNATVGLEFHRRRIPALLAGLGTSGITYYQSDPTTYWENYDPRVCQDEEFEPEFKTPFSKFFGVPSNLKSIVESARHGIFRVLIETFIRGYKVTDSSRQAFEEWLQIIPLELAKEIIQKIREWGIQPAFDEELLEKHTATPYQPTLTCLDVLIYDGIIDLQWAKTCGLVPKSYTLSQLGEGLLSNTTSVTYKRQERPQVSEPVLEDDAESDWTEDWLQQLWTRKVDPRTLPYNPQHIDESESKEIEGFVSKTCTNYYSDISVAKRDNSYPSNELASFHWHSEQNDYKTVAADMIFGLQDFKPAETIRDRADMFTGLAFYPVFPVAPLYLTPRQFFVPARRCEGYERPGLLKLGAWLNSPNYHDMLRLAQGVYSGWTTEIRWPTTGGGNASIFLVGETEMRLYDAPPPEATPAITTAQTEPSSKPNDEPSAELTKCGKPSFIFDVTAPGCEDAPAPAPFNWLLHVPSHSTHCRVGFETPQSPESKVIDAVMKPNPLERRGSQPPHCVETPQKQVLMRVAPNKGNEVVVNEKGEVTAEGMYGKDRNGNEFLTVGEWLISEGSRVWKDMMRAGGYDGPEAEFVKSRTLEYYYAEAEARTKEEGAGVVHVASGGPEKGV